MKINFLQRFLGFVVVGCLFSGVGFAEDAKTQPAAAPAKEAKEDFSKGFENVGSGFKNGISATGRTFQKIGLKIKDYFAGTSSADSTAAKPENAKATDVKKSGKVTERDLNAPVAAPMVEAPQKGSDLDAVGNQKDKAPKTQPQAAPATGKSNF